MAKLTDLPYELHKQIYNEVERLEVDMTREVVRFDGTREQVPARAWGYTMECLRPHTQRYLYRHITCTNHNSFFKLVRTLNTAPPLNEGAAADEPPELLASLVETLALALDRAEEYAEPPAHFEDARLEEAGRIWARLTRLRALRLERTALGLLCLDFALFRGVGLGALEAVEVVGGIEDPTRMWDPDAWRRIAQDIPALRRLSLTYARPPQVRGALPAPTVEKTDPFATRVVALAVLDFPDDHVTAVANLVNAFAGLQELTVGCDEAVFGAFLARVRLPELRSLTFCGRGAAGAVPLHGRVNLQRFTKLREVRVKCTSLANDLTFVFPSPDCLLALDALPDTPIAALLALIRPGPRRQPALRHIHLDLTFADEFKARLAGASAATISKWPIKRAHAFQWNDAVSNLGLRELIGACKAQRVELTGTCRAALPFEEALGLRQRRIEWERGAPARLAAKQRERERLAKEEAERSEQEAKEEAERQAKMRALFKPSVHLRDYEELDVFASFVGSSPVDDAAELSAAVRLLHLGPWFDHERGPTNPPGEQLQSELAIMWPQLANLKTLKIHKMHTAINSLVTGAKQVPAALTLPALETLEVSHALRTWNNPCSADQWRNLLAALPSLLDFDLDLDLPDLVEVQLPEAVGAAGPPLSTTLKTLRIKYSSRRLEPAIARFINAFPNLDFLELTANVPSAPGILPLLHLATLPVIRFGWTAGRDSQAPPLTSLDLRHLPALREVEFTSGLCTPSFRLRLPRRVRRLTVGRAANVPLAALRTFVVHNRPLTNSVCGRLCLHLPFDSPCVMSPGTLTATDMDERGFGREAVRYGNGLAWTAQVSQEGLRELLAAAKQYKVNVTGTCRVALVLEEAMELYRQHVAQHGEEDSESDEYGGWSASEHEFEPHRKATEEDREEEREEPQRRSYDTNFDLRAYYRYN